MPGQPDLGRGKRSCTSVRSCRDQGVDRPLGHVRDALSCPDVRTRLRPESAASKRCFPYKVWLTFRATGDNFNAVRKREFGVAAADVPQVVLEVVQQVNHGAAHGHRE